MRALCLKPIDDRSPHQKLEYIIRIKDVSNVCALTTRSAGAAQYISAKFRGDNFSGKLSGSVAGSACFMAQKQHNYHMLMIMTAS
jgi:hypothetical protein